MRNRPSTSSPASPAKTRPLPFAWPQCEHLPLLTAVVGGSAFLATTSPPLRRSFSSFVKLVRMGGSYDGSCRTRSLTMATQFTASIFETYVGSGFCMPLLSNKEHVSEILWQHWEQGTPDVSQDAILEAVKSSRRDRLDHVFRVKRSKFHPAWGTMIVRGSTKGTFRLQEPGGKNS